MVARCARSAQLVGWLGAGVLEPSARGARCARSELSWSGGWGLGSWTTWREEPEAEGVGSGRFSGPFLRRVFWSPRDSDRLFWGSHFCLDVLFLTLQLRWNSLPRLASESEGTSAIISGRQARLKPQSHISNKHLSNLQLLQTTHQAPASPSLRFSFLLRTLRAGPAFAQQMSVSAPVGRAVTGLQLQLWAGGPGHVGVSPAFSQHRSTRPSWIAKR